MHLHTAAACDGALELVPIGDLGSIVWLAPRRQAAPWTVLLAVCEIRYVGRQSRWLMERQQTTRRLLGCWWRKLVTGRTHGWPDGIVMKGQPMRSRHQTPRGSQRGTHAAQGSRTAGRRRENRSATKVRTNKTHIDKTTTPSTTTLSRNFRTAAQCTEGSARGLVCPTGIGSVCARPTLCLLASVAIAG